MRCMLMFDDIKALRTGRNGSTEDTQRARDEVKECMEEHNRFSTIRQRKAKLKRGREGQLSELSLFKVESFLEDEAWRLRKTVPEMRSLLTSEPLHNFHL